MRRGPVVVSEGLREAASISSNMRDDAAARPALSTRADRIPPSPIRKLSAYAAEAKARGIRVYHLNIGQPDIPTPSEFFEAVGRFFEKEAVLAYGDSQGCPELRRAMLDYYRRIGLNVGEEEVIVTMGASEALQFAYLTICNAGGEIVVFEPLYSNIISYMAMCDVRPVPITLDPRNSFRLPPASEIEKRITPRTKAIQICSPNNPTGTIISREDLEGLAGLCLKYNLFLISDEVYREFTYDGKSHISAIDLPEIAGRVVVADSISKRFSACGARIGAIISRNRDLIAKALVCAQARLCPPMIEQMGAAACFRLPAGFYEPVVREYQRRRDTLCRGLAEIPGASSFVPAGAFYLMASLPVDSSESFCKWLLTDFDDDGETVMFAPGPGFYVTPGLGAREIRIAYVLECPKIERAMSILRKALDAYPGRETR